MFQKNWENRKEVKTAWFACQYWRKKKKFFGGEDVGEKIMLNRTVSWIYKTQEEKFPSEGKWIFMNLDSVYWEALFESFVPLNFVSWELHTLINRKPFGNALDLYFLLGDTIIKCIYFLRTLVLRSRSIHKIFSLWMCGSNTTLLFSRSGKTRKSGMEQEGAI